MYLSHSLEYILDIFEVYIEMFLHHIKNHNNEQIKSFLVKCSQVRKRLIELFYFLFKQEIG